MAAPPPPPQWVLDLNSTSPTKPRSGTFPDPPGFTSTTTLQQSKATKNGKAITPRAKPSPEEMETLKLKKAWEVAIAPAKQLPMNAIGMYMSGNSLQMFSIMMVFMLFKAPIQALMNINQTFARFESDGKKQEMLMVKAAFIGCNLLALALGTWKVNQMGLLPWVFFTLVDMDLELMFWDQDYEIRLACVGSGERTVGTGVLYPVMRNDQTLSIEDQAEENPTYLKFFSLRSPLLLVQHKSSTSILRVECETQDYNIHAHDYFKSRQARRANEICSRQEKTKAQQ